MKKLVSFIFFILMANVVSANTFVVGDVWGYEAREGESSSKITILKVESLKGQDIVHISVEDVRIKNVQAPNRYMKKVAHIPISAKALKESVIEQVGKVNKLPEYEGGYNLWKEAFDSGKGGVFTISVKECINYLEQAINK